MSRVHGRPGVDFGIEDVRGRFPEEVEITPLDAPPDSTLTVPGSKSLTNRALIVAALSNGITTLENPLLSDDSFWLMKALDDLGFDVRVQDGDVTVGGLSGGIPARDVEVYVGNAGTVARFLPPFLALGDGSYLVDGVPRMRERPVSDLVDALRSLGATVEYASAEGRFPLSVSGGGIEGGRASISGRRSSQFLSGCLLAAPYARSPVELRVIEEDSRQSYVGITRDVMASFGVEVGYDPSSRTYSVGRGSYQAREYAVEPDASGASYFFAAAAVTGGRVRVDGLGRRSTQGDMRFVEVLRRMGCEVEVEDGYTEVRGPGRLRGVEVDMNDFSDTAISLAAIAPFASSPTRITNIEHTRHQETDRINAVATELSKLGVRVEEFRDGLEIHPGEVRPGLVETYEDHRIAMAFSVIGLRVPGIRILNPSCVTKTLPDFFRRLGLLGAGGD